MGNGKREPRMEGVVKRGKNEQAATKEDESRRSLLKRALYSLAFPFLRRRSEPFAAYHASPFFFSSLAALFINAASGGGGGGGGALFTLGEERARVGIPH